MTTAYHLFLSLLLILIQTTALTFGGSVHLYDLLVPFVVYLGIHRTLRQALAVLILAGMVMDGLSGGVFGIHLSAYLWLYAGVRWAIQFLHVGNTILLPVLVTLGVTFKSVLVAFSAVVLSPAPWPVETVFPVVSIQILWGALTGPFLMIVFVRGQKVVDQAQKSFFSEKDSLGTP